METALQQLNADRNKMSKEIGARRGRGEASAELEDRVRQIGEQISALTQEIGASEGEARNLFCKFRICRTAMRRLGRTRALIP